MKSLEISLFPFRMIYKGRAALEEEWESTKTGQQWGKFGVTSGQKMHRRRVGIKKCKF
jgi:hypothetical protein